ncbi:Uncharacterised protein [Mycobacteroides abscessus subsp. abscessus]|nr:Uncharacterised protein [Mycobacteroides abscessus subsp. abscessus]
MSTMITSYCSCCCRNHVKASAVTTRARGSFMEFRFNPSSRGSVRASWIIAGSSSTRVGRTPG